MVFVCFVMLLIIHTIAVTRYITRMFTIVVSVALPIAHDNLNRSYLSHSARTKVDSYIHIILTVLVHFFIFAPRLIQIIIFVVLILVIFVIIHFLVVVVMVIAEVMMKVVMVIMYVVLDNSLQHSKCRIPKYVRRFVAILHLLDLFRNRRSGGNLVHVTRCISKLNGGIRGESVDISCEVFQTCEDIVNDGTNIREIQLDIRHDCCE